jgi:hypothetical protein
VDNCGKPLTPTFTVVDKSTGAAIQPTQPGGTAYNLGCADYELAVRVGCGGGAAPVQKGRTMSIASSDEFIRFDEPSSTCAPFTTFADAALSVQCSTGEASVKSIGSSCAAIAADGCSARVEIEYQATSPSCQTTQTDTQAYTLSRVAA